MQEDTIKTQYMAIMATLGDEESQKTLATLAAGKGEGAVAAQDGLLMSQWWQSTGDAAKQKKVLDEAIGVLKDNPKKTTGRRGR